jgi:hypothetical protein
MSNTKNTPGPWVIDKSNPVKIQGIGPQPQIRYPVCSVSAFGKHWQANARLIAAAPELLDALELIANALSPNALPVNGMMVNYDHALMVREEADRCFEIARAAIAKATGQ